MGERTLQIGDIYVINKGSDSKEFGAEGFVELKSIIGNQCIVASFNFHQSEWECPAANLSELTVAEQLWVIYRKLVKSSKNDEALLEVYDTLRGFMVMGKYDYCDEFISILQKAAFLDVSLNVLVHSINSMHSKRNKLERWPNLISITITKANEEFNNDAEGLRRFCQWMDNYYS